MADSNEPIFCSRLCAKCVMFIFSFISPYATVRLYKKHLLCLATQHGNASPIHESPSIARSHRREAEYCFCCRSYRGRANLSSSHSSKHPGS